MSAALPALESAIAEADRLHRVLKRGRPRVQVTLVDERSLVKATVLAWFNNHMRHVGSVISETDLFPVNATYTELLESSDRAGARNKYLARLKTLKQDLVRLRSACVSGPALPAKTTPDQPPDFAPLISDPAMQKILIGRWRECAKCLEADVPLAATVMMGGLLEALLLARINKEPTKEHIFTARTAPKDKFGKTRPLSDWMLNDYIQVIHELKWITQSARDVGAVLRDYRNYIHPQKQLSHGVHLTKDDASLLWEISKSITRQIISSVS